jgi:hypothetical protein
MLARLGPAILPPFGGSVIVRALRTGDRIGYTPVAVSRARKALHIFHPSQLRTLFDDLASYPWHGIEVHGYPHRVLICLGEAQDGRLVCTGVLIDPKKNLEVSSRLLRDIRLGEVVASAAAFSKVLPVGRVLRSTPYRVRRTRPGPAGHPAKFYKDVANVYRRALRTHPRTPVVRLMAELSCSEATAHRYLKRCRELGLLDPRTPKGGNTS